MEESGMTDAFEKYLFNILDGDKNNRTPVIYQLSILNIKSLIDENSGEYRGLDIGCGDGSLVEYLRKKGIDFEGMDASAPGEKYFIKQNVHGIHPMHGCIPRPDETYDLVVGFQNATINSGFLSLDDIEYLSRHLYDDVKETHVNSVMNAQFIILETLRILKRGGRGIFYPEIERLEEIMGLALKAQDVSIYTEDIPEDEFKRYAAYRRKGLLEENAIIEDYQIPDYTSSTLKKRTVLAKK
jgi:SAM-dependent methyltransferase